MDATGRKRSTFACIFENACNFLYMPFERRGTPRKPVSLISNSDGFAGIEFGRCGSPPLVSASSTLIAGSNHPYEPLVVLFCIAALQTQLLSPLSRPQRVLSGKLVPSQCAETIIASKGNFAEAMILPSTPGQVMGGLEPGPPRGGTALSHFQY
jgi:hypothetical protein